MTKKLLAFLLTILMIVAVAAGCNSNGDTNSGIVDITDSTVVDGGNQTESNADTTDSSVPGGAGESSTGTDNNSRTESTDVSASTNSTASGTGSTSKPNGTTSTTQPNNSATSNTKPGTTSTTQPNGTNSNTGSGTTSTTKPNSSTTSNTKPGTSSTSQPNNSTTSNTKPGTTSTTKPNSSTTSNTKPGTTSTTQPNNSTTSNTKPGTTSTTQPNGTSSNTSSGTASTTKPTTLRGTTVKFATWIDVNKTEYGPVIQAFTKSTGIKVKIVNVPQHEYITKLTGLIASGNSPDVINDNSEFPRTIGITQPITVAGINPNDSRWNPIITEMSTINGKTYLISSNQASFQTSGLLYYNKTLFANNGIKSPEQYVKENNWNWDTFNKAASDIKNAAGIKLGCVFDTGVFTSSYGAGFVKYKQGQFYSGIDETVLTDTWRFLQTGVKSSLFNLGAKSQFVEGQAAMCVTDTYGLKKSGYFSAMKNSDLGVTYLPKKNATDNNYPRGGFITAYGIAKGAQNAAGAGEFLKFYLNMDNYDTKKIYKTEEFTAFAKEVIKIPTTLNTVYWDDSLQDLTGQTFNKYVITSDPSQIEANLEKVKNTVNAAVKKANDMLATAK